MESGAEGANSGKRVSQWLTCRFVASGTRLEVQSADSKSDRVWNWGGGGRLRGQMKMSRRMENRMEVVLQNCLENLE